MNKFLDKTGLQLVWKQINNKFASKASLENKVDKVSGKGLSTNDYTTEEKNKLAGISAGANNYALPQASGTTLGGVKVGSNISVSGGTISLNKNNVTAALGYTPPTQDTNTHYESKTITGASSTATANAAASNGSVYLNHVENGAVKSSHNIKGTGATTVISDGNGVITVNSTNTTYGVATQSANGLMSSADKTKLNGVEAGAQKNTVTGIKGNAETTYRTGNVNLTPANIGAAAASHTHTIANVTNLQTALDGKAASSHTHAISDVTNLQTTLNGKAAASHTHDDRYYTESEVNTKLNAKANTSHTHKSSEISDISTFVNKAKEVTTLSEKPTETTLTHTVNGVSVNYVIGEMVRVTDASSSTGYRFYILHDILNGKAVWGESVSDYVETVKVTVTADDGTSVAGIVITVNGTNYTLDSTGVVSVKIAYGVQYDIAPGTKTGYTTPSGSTFTAGQATRNVSLVYKKITLGTFIEDINGNLYTRSEWGSSSHGTANAVVVLTDACKVRLALTQASGTMQIHSSSNGALENYMTAISNEAQAKADYNGAANTTNIMKLQSSTSYAAGWCNAFKFPNGTTGCLPSLGQLWTLYQNKTEVNACLSACGGTAMSTNDYYWSSTFWGISGSYRYCWMLSWSDGSVNYYSLNYYGYVRAVSAY